MRCKAVIILLLLFPLLLPLAARANNIQVVNPRLDTLSMDSIPGYCAVEFGLSWENSWRLPERNNWDAAWVFCKAYTRCLGSWKHAEWHQNPAMHRVLSSENGVALNIRVSDDRVGALVYRKAEGSGSIGAKLRMWFKFPGNALCTMQNDTVIVGIFAIEMVYIPEREFQLGDQKSSNTLYSISKNIGVGTGKSAAESINSTSGYSFNGTVLPAGFPTGFGAFYLMKHEITQNAYVDFLNTLTYNEQAKRTAVAPNLASGTYAMTTLASPQQYRNFIRIRFSGDYNQDKPATYGSSVNESDWDRENNGGNIACNFLSWEDLIAYADWAGLRPQTELEFEKACRGQVTYKGGEFAWGNSLPYYVTRVGSLWFQNENKANEVSVKATVQTEWYDNFNALKTGEAPWAMRVGAFANDSTGRSSAGAGYYGNMNLSDNVWDRCVSVETAGGQAFTGTHGNGILSTVQVGEGDFVSATVRTYTSSILRGFEISNRGAANINGRHQACGGRLARTVSGGLAD